MDLYGLHSLSHLMCSVLHPTRIRDTYSQLFVILPRGQVDKD
jgi:hypothetical protein